MGCTSVMFSNTNHHAGVANVTIPGFAAVGIATLAPDTRLTPTIRRITVWLSRENLQPVVMIVPPHLMQRVKQVQHSELHVNSGSVKTMIFTSVQY